MEYDASAGPLVMAMHYYKTVVPVVMCRVDFWLYFIAHVAIHVLWTMGYLHQPNTAMSWSDLRTITAMTTFFEVFYTGECFSRYMQLFGLVKKSFSHAYDFVFACRFFVQPCRLPYDRLACHWLSAALILSFLEAREKRKVGPVDIQKIYTMGLLKQSDFEFVQHLNGHSRMMVMLNIAGDIAREGFIAAKCPKNSIKEALNSLDQFRSAQQEMHDLMAFPLPFEYVHFLCLMIALNMTLWAYGIATADSIFGPMFFFVSSLIFVGMMDLASQLADPFGEDEADFPLPLWLREFLHNLSALLDYEHDGVWDDFVQDLEEEDRHPTDFRIDVLRMKVLLTNTEEDVARSTTANSLPVAANWSENSRSRDGDNGSSKPLLSLTR
mmetsp:Transcript_96648/g.191592  ORF Transcript_96648/g.191592 Transcript_96648/m.191592 type:complete len:382 (+) Transcript_96648:110-1255(+)